MDFATRFLEARTSAGLTHEELARRAGVTPRTIARIEAGKRSVRLKTLDQVAEALWCSVHVELRDATDEHIAEILRG
ncbi:helix-turn-helix domain-containing protein [Gordonia paraffinivorans]|uniref:helix-turn-helix domain-containing protein n=1 Tax=Gordonia paraffinivorans TaxID=175628 RepID=UPI001E390BB5|nr:helix-turn-helix transcriptional regulator [Gordonia paraffinivorans]MCD2143719.1 helix-turn-helix transcriptional regulator [Gordonia paraffinivorans]